MKERAAEKQVKYLPVMNRAIIFAIKRSFIIQALSKRTILPVRLGNNKFLWIV